MLRSLRAVGSCGFEFQVNRDHRIRLAVKHLSGDARQKAVVRLLRIPPSMLARHTRAELSKALRPHHSMRRRAKAKNGRGRRTIYWGVMLTPEEWLEFRDKALTAKVSMAQLLRHRIGLGAANRSRVKHGHAHSGETSKIRPKSGDTVAGNAKAETSHEPSPSLYSNWGLK